MFMRQYIKQGEMFKLDRKSSRGEQNNSETNVRVSAAQDLEDQNQYKVNQVSARRRPDYPEINVQQLAMNNGGAIVMCGAFMCCLCSIIGGLIFYFYLFEYVQPYIPQAAYDYIPFIEKPAGQMFLSELNAKQYFAQHQLIAGEFHYARVPVEYWPHRIQMLKSMGFNSLGVYVFWNYHQTSKGVFDFQTKNKNLTYLLELAKQHGMDVLLRPGPYVCAEWDLGGLPPRLLSVEGIKIRTSDRIFIEETKIYFSQLSQIVKKYIKNKTNPQGPILMIQVENEPSWITKQKLYIDELKRLWDEIDIGCPLYFDDILDGYKNHTIFWDHAILAMNQYLYNQDDFDTFTTPDHFLFAGEVYSGWFTSWGGSQWEKQFAQEYDKKFLKQFEDMLSVNTSFSMYMAHGGTNFGLTAGYNMITSYDYFAPINEQGLPTEKFHIFRSLILNYANKIPPAIPEPIETMSVSFGKTVAINSLFNSLPESISLSNREKPFVFESSELQMYNQGLVLYETTIKGPFEYVYQIVVHDVAFVYLDGQYKQTIVRTEKNLNIKKQEKTLKIKCENSSCKLEILVQPMGHVNFGLQLNIDRKGIIKFEQESSNRPAELTSRQWKHYKFELQGEPKWKNLQKCTKAPCLYEIQADLIEAKDTYIDMTGFKKGYVWVNGINLGRYWDIGPIRSIYCPGIWLKKGKNKITILDFYVANAQITIKGTQGPK